MAISLPEVHLHLSWISVRKKKDVQCLVTAMHGWSVQCSYTYKCIYCSTAKGVACCYHQLEEGKRDTLGLTVKTDKAETSVPAAQPCTVSLPFFLLLVTQRGSDDDSDLLRCESKSTAVLEQYIYTTSTRMYYSRRVALRTSHCPIVYSPTYSCSWNLLFSSLFFFNLVGFTALTCTCRSFIFSHSRARLEWCDLLKSLLMLPFNYAELKERSIDRPSGGCQCEQCCQSHSCTIMTMNLTSSCSWRHWSRIFIIISLVALRTTHKLEWLQSKNSWRKIQQFCPLLL